MLYRKIEKDIEEYLRADDDRIIYDSVSAGEQEKAHGRQGYTE